MKRSLILLGLVFLTPAIAAADNSGAGKKGYVTAYAADGETILEVASCPRKGLSWDYNACGNPLRERIKARLCSEKGKGKHEWKYQVSNGIKMKSTAYCR
jgi:hypothetical protein